MTERKSIAEQMTPENLQVHLRMDFGNDFGQILTQEMKADKVIIPKTDQGHTLLQGSL